MIDKFNECFIFIYANTFQQRMTLQDYVTTLEQLYSAETI